MTAGVAPARRRLPFTEAVRPRTLSNGARVFVVENHFNPTVAIGGSLAAGRLYAPADRRLIASLTAGELMKGTSRRTKLELAEDLESRAASLGFNSDASDPVGVDISGGALSRDTELFLEHSGGSWRCRRSDDELERRSSGCRRYPPHMTSLRFALTKRRSAASIRRRIPCTV